VTGVSGDIVSGVYIPEGATVSLRAAPQVDAVFLGWTGDTIAGSDALSLRMLHPYSVTANFIAVQQVPLPDAAAALMGATALDGQKAVYLDAAGNRNGAYDLGDFLAALGRTGTPALVMASSSPGKR
jgi:hypothetical protein